MTQERPDTTPDVQEAENIEAKAPEPTVSGELLDIATAVRDTLDAWVQRMAGTAAAGRSATVAARMATARAIADLRGLQAPDSDEPNAGEVVEYLRRARSTLANAARDIERNRYSLLVMQQQLERLKQIADRIWPEQNERDEPESGAPASSADN
jgi:hypothetical protein